MKKTHIVLLVLLSIVFTVFSRYAPYYLAQRTTEKYLVALRDNDQAALNDLSTDTHQESMRNNIGVVNGVKGWEFKARERLSYDPGDKSRGYSVDYVIRILLDMTMVNESGAEIHKDYQLITYGYCGKAFGELVPYFLVSSLGEIKE
ncbi:MAG: hypothetical protein HQK89_11070 [Nitrospirae bacterium]|nr:hypothetical protein [Nitrospirota bacterium]